jgi:FkbM family methyltransferase
MFPPRPQHGDRMPARKRIIYDVGHHKGEDTEFYLQLGFDVVAIEANPRLIELSKARFRDAIESGRLHLIEGAIAPPSAGERITFFDNPSDSVWGTISPDWASRNAKLGYESAAIDVARVDIGEVFRTYGIPYYLKIDVEGADRLPLEELRTTPDRPQYVSLESEKVDFEALRGELELLSSLGYRKFKVVQQADIPGRTIEASQLDGTPLRYTFAEHASGAFGEDIPQPWLTLDEALQEYRSIFRRYRLFGDHSLADRMPYRVRQALRRGYKLATGYRGPLPGWFDTHASL